MNWDMYIRFSILHFLEFAIWGAWFVVLANYLNSLGFSRKAIGSIYGTMPLGAIISPMFLGLVADRYFDTQQVIGWSHLIGAVLLLAMARVRRPGLFYAAALLYALAYSPTLSLVNSIVFRHIDQVFPDAVDPRDLFGRIRTFGTIGWIAAGLSLKLLLKPNRPVDNKPILLAAALSAILGVFSFALPDTPPQAETINPFAAAVKLLADPNFAVFFFVSVVVAMGMAIYFAFGALFVELKARVKPQNVGPVMTLGQWVEITFLALLEKFLGYLGMPVVLLIGVGAWTLRFAIFAWSRSLPMILLGVALHGICFDFFFAAGFINVDHVLARLDAKEITASAQTLYGVAVYGLGMLLGSLAAGWLNDANTREIAPAAEGEPPQRETNWTRFWGTAFAGMLVSLLVYIASLRLLPHPPAQPQEPDSTAQPAEPDEVAGSARVAGQAPRA